MTRMHVPRQPATQTTDAGCWSSEAAFGAPAPVRRVEVDNREVDIRREEREPGWPRLPGVGYPGEVSADEAWIAFAPLRSKYAPTGCQLKFWIIAAPAAWSRDRDGFPEISDSPDAPKDVVGRLSAGVSVRLSCRHRVRRPAADQQDPSWGIPARPPRSPSCRMAARACR